ncbi:Zinc finger protein MAGPIE [Dichanthelium oligosanthes]|uniref:Protein EARLY HEADING DATE 2 n=1 Tax=Dichanthelium oligosanthes TaxID=888268 RepID=A0A1E5VAN5_9POAL|nr:Zinc finger protein MAGPIE [Dichanthelium oligosanthes]
MASEAASIISNPFAPITNQQQQPPPPPPPPPCQQAEQQPPLPPPAKKKRNLPGTPGKSSIIHPDAEVIALSPRTLLATNRFVCEICGKGFQRDQNLQLHRRGHNLPWKLRQRSGKEPRKRVYVCPEKSCVHHNPARALGDLTGIKKHFCRKHGEKKWKCEKCSKRYAVQSDWKAHSKTCGTREYRCDCGTLFSRRDSFITHRAFCDALAEETARLNAAAGSSAATSSLCGQSYLFAGSPAGLAVLPTNNIMMLPSAPASPHLKPAGQLLGGLSLWGGATLLPMGDIGGVGAPVPPQLYADLFAPSSGAPPRLDAAQLGWLYGNGKLSSSNASELMTTTEADSSVPSVFSGQQHAKPAAPTDMSATALLRKAAQMGAMTSSGNEMSAEDDAVAGGAMFGASQQTSANNLITAATGNVAYDDVLLAAVRHAGLKDAVGREETRDFLGVGVQALCSSSLPLHGWI